MTVARRYALAALAVAQAEKQPLPTLANAMALLTEAVAAPAVAEALKNPRLTPVQRKQLATCMAKAVAAPQVLTNLLQLLAAKRRLEILPEVLAALQAEIAAQAGIAEATVHTAKALTDTQKITLKMQIKTHTKAKDVRLVEMLKPELLGGFRAFFGGLVWDASVLGGLNRLKATLKQD
jgi:F-type H+-transporting ATPase subunit delta